MRPQVFFEEPDDKGGEGKTPKVGGKEQVHVSEEARNFGKRFAPPAEILAQGGELPSQKEGDSKPPNGTPPKPPERKDDRRQHRPPGDNVPAIVEGKRKAEAERDEARAKLQEFETKTVPELNTQIATLQTKIDSGQLTPAKEAELQGKIDALTKEKDDSVKAIKDELETTRTRLRQLSLPDDPIYKEKYLRPMGESIEVLKNIVGTQPVLQQALNRALTAQRAYLQASTPEEQTAMQTERDQVLDQMLEGMSSVQQRRLNAAFDRYMETSEAQAIAVAQWEQTDMEVRQESEKRFKDATVRTMQDWEREFDGQAAAYADDIKIDQEIEDKMKELGLKVDVAAEEKMAREAIQGKLKKGDVVRLIHRGRVQPILVAKLKAKDAIIAGLQETITKLRGSSPGGGSKGGGTPPTKGEAVNTEGQTRADWQKKFRPPTS